MKSDDITENTQEISPRGDETILIIDDEELIRTLGKEILEKHGYAVMLASDGKEGLNTYLREKERIDLILLDLSMPHLSGREVLDQLCVVAPKAKVIVSSGYSEDAHGAFSNLVGTVGYISKPYRAHELLKTVRLTLDGDL